MRECWFGVEVWDELGGFDRAIRLFREDVDLGWRANLAGHRVVVTPQAVVHHAEAVTHHRRERDCHRRHPRRPRQCALRLAGKHLTPWSGAAMAAGSSLVSGLRALGFLLGKAPHEASAELAAMSQVLFRPGILRRGRRARRRHRIVPARTLRSLFPPPGHQVRQSLETAVAALNLDTETPTSSVLESGPSEEDLDSFVGQGSGRIRRWVRRPGVIVFTFVLLIMALAWRGLYRGGVLHGGGLLPLPQGASDVWSDYLASWHPVTAGSPVAASPASAVMALLGTLLLGKATWVVPVVMVIGPAIAAARRLRRALDLWVDGAHPGLGSAGLCHEPGAAVVDCARHAGASRWWRCCSRCSHCRLRERVDCAAIIRQVRQLRFPRCCSPLSWP